MRSKDSRAEGSVAVGLEPTPAKKEWGNAESQQAHNIRMHDIHEIWNIPRKKFLKINNYIFVDIMIRV